MLTKTSARGRIIYLRLMKRRVKVWRPYYLFFSHFLFLVYLKYILIFQLSQSAYKLHKYKNNKKFYLYNYNLKATLIISQDPNCYSDFVTQWLKFKMFRNPAKNLNSSNGKLCNSCEWTLRILSAFEWWFFLFRSLTNTVTTNSVLVSNFRIPNLRHTY